MLVLLAVICLAVPPILTLLNIINLFKKKKITEGLVDALIFLLGIPLTFLLLMITTAGDYDHSLLLTGFDDITLHRPIASWSMPTVYSILSLGVMKSYKEKPLEWLFLIVLYSFDKKPENRIATQYTGTKGRFLKKSCDA